MLTSSYEQLREGVLTGLTLTSRRWGWNLLLTRGLAAWIDAWHCLEDPPRQFSPTSAASSTVETLSLPEPVQQQITVVLAEMILHQSRISA